MGLLSVYSRTATVRPRCGEGDRPRGRRHPYPEACSSAIGIAAGTNIGLGSRRTRTLRNLLAPSGVPAIGFTEGIVSVDDLAIAPSRRT